MERANTKMTGQQIQLRRLMLTLLLISLYAVCQSHASALSDQEKAMWGASKNTSTVFTVPSPQGQDVMGKAQGLISQWNGIDHGMYPVMKIQTVTDSLIQTYTPDEINALGFTVTRSTTDHGDEISVSSLYYTGNIFSVSQDAKNALKRARLLSYLLQQYATTITPPVQSAPTISNPSATESPQTLPDDLELYMKLIRVQLAAGNYDQALRTIEALKSTVLDKQKGKANLTLPTSPLSPVPPQTTPSSSG